MKEHEEKETKRVRETEGDRYSVKDERRKVVERGLESDKNTGKMKGRSVRGKDKERKMVKGEMEKNREGRNDG